jgi:hypothetical protein
MPLSGDCWILGEKAGSEKATLTAGISCKGCKRFRYTPQDYLLVCATAAWTLHIQLKPQIDAMKNKRYLYLFF